MKTVQIYLLPLIALLYFPVMLPGESVPENLAALRAVGVNGKGHKEAILAWKELSQLPADKLTAVLAGMDGASDLSVNWLRAVADTIAQRQIQQQGKLPLKDLEEFISDRSHHPRARRTAYEIIALVDRSAHDRIIPGLLDDPSLELRRDAVAHAILEAAKISDSSPAITAYRRALTSARDLDQIEMATKRIRDLGGEVNLPLQFGFLMEWALVGPFDNEGTKGFDRAYPPEVALELSHTYKGKEGDITWLQHATTDEFGTVDLNVALGKHKGAICYAHTVFMSVKDTAVEIRLGCINGNKVWVNGTMVTSNHVYHASTAIDQYIARANFRKGRNDILIKVAQNEQTEDWAQRWQFQLRVCDSYGTPILATDRKK
jgi:hypothetical protein